MKNDPFEAEKLWREACNQWGITEFDLGYEKMTMIFCNAYKMGKIAGMQEKEDND